MGRKGELRNLIIDIVTPVLIFAMISCILFLEQRGYHVETGSEDGGLIDEDTWYIVRNKNAGMTADNSPKCLLIFADNDEESIAVKDNIEYVLNSINVSTATKKVNLPDEEGAEKSETTADIVMIEDYNEYDDIIFCISDLTYAGIETDELAVWLNGGGHAMFAAGLDPNDDILDWLSILGITNDTIPETVNANSLQFTSSIMAGVEDRTFSDDVINCNVANVCLDDSCLIHMSTGDEDEIPLLWEKPHDNGAVIVCNADIFDTKTDRGIIAAAYCEFYPAFVYPVINSAVYCIDDCPAPTPAGYDDNVLSQYGYTVNDFITNIWMPEMEKIAETYDLRYTTFTIQSYSDDVDGPFDNQDNIKSAKYYASLILNMGGEIGIHGYNHQPLVLEGFVFDKENAGYKAWPSIKKIVESIDEVINYTENLADDLHVQAYIAPSNVISDEALHELQVQFEDLRVYAGIYIGTSDQMVQEFSVLENGTVYCPRLTADMQMEDSEWWTQINELNYHYVESNFIHPDDILDEERSDGGDFSQMLANYTDMIEWNQRYGLCTSTISECGAAVQRYCNINYKQAIHDNIMSIEVDGLIDTAYMMLRLNGKRPVSMEGGNYWKLSENIYILEIDRENVSIKLGNQS